MRLQHINIKGYRPFADFDAEVGALEVMVGANGSGKSSLFEFLRFLRDGMYQEIPPEIVAGSSGQQVFHVPGPERFAWTLDMCESDMHYAGELTGPVGRTLIPSERIWNGDREFLRRDNGFRATVSSNDSTGQPSSSEISLMRGDQFALRWVNDPRLGELSAVSEYIRGWRFYSAYNIRNETIRRSVPVEQDPILHEDGGNLSSVLFYLLAEHPDVFHELQVHLRGVVPGFKRLTVKARGGPGEVMGFWSEGGVDQDLSLADLSDGSLRLLCWFTLCLLPKPPALICIDEPDQGVHPRTLPVLAGLINKASARTQILLATHSSYFLTQFEFSDLAVVRKEAGASVFLKPADSKVLIDILDDFGSEELEALHRSDELERFA